MWRWQAPGWCTVNVKRRGKPAAVKCFSRLLVVTVQSEPSFPFGAQLRMAPYARFNDRFERPAHLLAVSLASSRRPLVTPLVDLGGLGHITMGAFGLYRYGPR